MYQKCHEFYFSDIEKYTNHDALTTDNNKPVHITLYLRGLLNIGRAL